MIRLLVLAALMATWGSVECRPKEGVGNRILGGENAGTHEFPEALRMVYKDVKGDRYICSGSIINSYWGLTAGHCCKDFVEGKVYEGSSYKSQLNEHEINPKYCIAHERFVGLPYNMHDIAVFKVLTEFSLDGITNKAIKLPEVGYSTPNEFQATAVGWGMYSWTPEAAPDILQKIQLTVSERIRFDEYIFISKAYGGLTGVCHGDSGGPLYYNGTVVGLTVGGIIECNITDPIGKHTIVSDYRTWIDRTILKFD